MICFYCVKIKMKYSNVLEMLDKAVGKMIVEFQQIPGNSWIYPKDCQVMFNDIT